MDFIISTRSARSAISLSFFSKFSISRVPVHISDWNQDRKAVVTPSRDEVAQARLLDARRVLRIWERRQRSAARSFRQGFARFGRDAE